MYINLILGGLVLAALIWLLAEHRRRKRARRDPAEMLRDEISRRRAAQSLNRQALAALAALRSARLAEVARGLERMRRALPEEGGKADLLRWQVKEDRIEFELASARPESGAPTPANLPFGQAGEVFTIRWDVRDLDLALFAAGEGAPPAGARGEYTLEWADRSVLAEKDLTAFLQSVSAIIAEKLA